MAYTAVLEETLLDYPSPDDNAIIVYLTGCEHHCPGCHSPLIQKVQEYTETPEELTEKLVDYCRRAETNKIVLLGGDPLHETNIPYTKHILQTLSHSYDICIFTGYSIDYVKQLGISGAKYYKCGKFDINTVRKSLKTDDKYVLASPNQDFYDENYNKISENGILYFNSNQNEGN